MPPNLPPEQAWEPLPDSLFDRAAAAHLLRRIGWTATPAAVDDAVARGLDDTIRQSFNGSHEFPKPEAVERHAERVITERATLSQLSERERRETVNALRRDSQQLLRRYAVDWHRHAGQQTHAPTEKWVTFLHDVFVVGQPKVYDVALLLDHIEILRRGRFAPYRNLCRAVSRSPGMIAYLDLRGNRVGQPNENFARELFELFMLGEGNYTENDIKEAARAFTGYSRNHYVFEYRSSQHDSGRKTVFGQTGNWTGDDIIDLALRQPAAATFLPREMARFYLDPIGVPSEEQLAALGAMWRKSDFSLAWLAETFFRSRYFFDPSHRARQIKSPTQFYLGLLQDLQLDIPPFPGQLSNTLRALGQPFLSPPNVRGWVGGRYWINSATIAARRQVIRYHFTHLDESLLNADDLAELEQARAAGLANNIILSDDQLDALVDRPDDELLAYCFEYLLAEPPPAATRDVYRRHLQGHGRHERVRELLIALLESPAYQVC